uniref:succinate dehydrogenase subunit 3 n=1 Tax=Hypnea wynnei TaxID=1867777 RepID=UPI003002232E|nr:succinate dehydrogenase subunit 3 [Hypnea wynnei]
MCQKINMLNRPISPHLSIYNSQITSLSSIWHRISGIFLIVLIVSFNILSKVVVNCTFYLNSIVIQLDIVYFIYLVVLFLFLYHSFNGLRNIMWNLSYGFKVNNIKNFFFIMCSCIIFILVFNIV